MIECPNNGIGDFLNNVIGGIGNRIKIAAEWLADTVKKVIDFVVGVIESLLNIALVVVGAIVVAAGVMAVA